MTFDVGDVINFVGEVVGGEGDCWGRFAEGVIGNGGVS